MPKYERLTAGTAREIVDTSKTAGEAWYRLTVRSTEGTRRSSQLKRPPKINELFQLPNVIRKMVKEFPQQSPKELMPSAIVKAAHVKVVPEAYRSDLEPHNLEDHVLASETIRMEPHRFKPERLFEPVRLGGQLPDRNKYGSHWGQDHLGSTGDVVASGAVSMVSCTVCTRVKVAASMPCAFGKVLFRTRSQGQKKGTRQCWKGQDSWQGTVRWERLELSGQTVGSAQASRHEPFGV